MLADLDGAPALVAALMEMCRAERRQRILDDMAMRAMRSRTQYDYVRHVRAFAAFLARSPDTAVDLGFFETEHHDCANPSHTAE